MIDWICSFGPAWLIWAACVAVITYVVCKLLPDESLEGEKISALLVVLFSGASAIGLGSVGVIDPLAAPGRLWSNPYPTIVVVVGYLALGVVASLLWLRGHLREKCEQIAAIRSSWLAAAGGAPIASAEGLPAGLKPRWIEFASTNTSAKELIQGLRFPGYSHLLPGQVIFWPFYLVIWLSTDLRASMWRLVCAGVRRSCSLFRLFYEWAASGFLRDVERDLVPDPRPDPPINHLF